MSKTVRSRTEFSADAGRIRTADAADASTCEALAHAAYAKYVPRMSKPPSPLFYDYQEVVAAGHTYVFEHDGQVLAMNTLIPHQDHLLLRNLVVCPAWQGHGIGRRFMSFTEDLANRLERPEIRLWTNEAMWENVPYYEAYGYTVQAKRVVDGYTRIFMLKRLRPPDGKDGPVDGKHK